MKARPLSEEHRAAISAGKKGHTVSAECRAKISAKLKGRTLTAETCVKIRAALATPEVQAKLSATRRGRVAWNKGIPMTLERRLKLTEALRGRPSWNKGKPLSENHRAQLSIAHKGKTQSAQHRAAISAGLKGNPKVIAARISARAEQKFPFNDTKPELSVFRGLKLVGIPFKRQFRFDGIPHSFDFAIPSRKTLIEVDGCYWHACPIHRPESAHGRRRATRDIEIDAQARALGWKVIRIWEHELVSDPRLAA